MQIYPFRPKQHHAAATKHIIFGIWQLKKFSSHIIIALHVSHNCMTRVLRLHATCFTILRHVSHNKSMPFRDYA